MIDIRLRLKQLMDERGLNMYSLETLEFVLEYDQEHLWTFNESDGVNTLFAL